MSTLEILADKNKTAAKREVLKETTEGVKTWLKNVKGSDAKVRAATAELAETGGKGGIKASDKVKKTLRADADASQAATDKARKQLGVGAASAVALAALARAASKSSGKGSLKALSNKEKLVKGIKKNKKGIAIAGGTAAGGAGLAALLKKKD